MIIIIIADKKIFLSLYSYNRTIKFKQMLSKTSKYAIKSLIHLASHSDENNKLSTKILAEQTGIPSPFLSKILQQLSSRDYVSATKGPNGGFYLTPDQRSNSVYEIITAVEGRDIYSRCVLDLTQCDAQNPCSLHSFITDSMNALKANFKEVSLSNVAQRGQL